MLIPFRSRIQRSPDAGGSAGAAAVSAPTETAAKPAEAGAAAAETPSQPAPKPEAAGQEQPAAKPKMTDWQRYQRMQERFERNPNARPTKAELELRTKYEGKDEATIEGYAPSDQQQDDAPAAQSRPVEPKEPEAKAEAEQSEKKPEAPAIPKELESLIGEKSPIGAKTLADVPKKVESLVKEVRRLNGDFGAVGRVFDQMGAKNLGEAKEFVKNAGRLHTLVSDLKAGKAEAFEFIGFKGGKPQGQTAPSREAGAAPEDILDEGLFNRLHPEIQELKRKNERLERQLAERFTDVDAWKEAQRKTQATEARNQQVNEVITDVSTLVQGNEDLWDAKTAGSLNQALKEYYTSKEGEPYNPALTPILEILQIAKEKGIDDLAVAHAYWERQNRGTLLQKTREEARLPFTGKKPTVGLSDQQGQHSGQYKDYTKQQILNMGRPGYPKVPREWKDDTGTLVPEKIPAYARAVLWPEEIPEE